jgi:hypothetical protein
MKPRTAEKFDAMFPIWGAWLLVAAITITLVCLFFA